MDQQLSDARMRIVQLTAEVQSSKQATQHHEEKTAALQAQVLLYWCLTPHRVCDEHMHINVYTLVA